MSVDVAQLAGPALIIVLSYTIFGLTGFGSSIVAMPLLVHFIPLRTAVPIMLVFDLCAGLLLGLKNRDAVDRKELTRLVPFMLAGMVLGVTLLIRVPERALLLVLGIFVLTYSVWSLLFRPTFSRIAAVWSIPLGAVGGVFTALFGTGGPIYTIYLARRLEDKLVMRATISALIFMGGLARLVLFSGIGLYAEHRVLLLAALLLPCALAGLYLGNRLHSRLPVHRVGQAVWILLILGGMGLIVRTV
jgi:uncharacterized membrane protein YfcA